MAADAAAQHGHEFSTPTSTSPSLDSPSIPLHRFALNALLSAVSFQKPPPPDTLPEKVVLHTDPSHTHTARKSMMLRDSDTLSHASEDVVSNASTADDDPSRQKTRSSRSKSVFNLAHPPPGPRQRQKLHVRPRVLLQLHKLTPGSRPRPEFEVVPSTRCPVRFARKLGRIFKAIEKLGPDDVVVMRSDSYGPIDDNESLDDDTPEGGEPVGVVCVTRSQDGKSTRTEICMDDNSVWNVTQLRNGNYEFTSTDHHGLELKARWVVRAPKRRMSSQSIARVSAQTLAPDQKKKKFNFSTISADSRRHPVIASMTPKKLEIMHQYSVPAKADTSPGQTPQESPTAAFLDTGSGYLESQNLDLKDMAFTDDALRKFIIVSGVYVAFCENWSTAFRYAQPAAAAADSTTTLDGSAAAPAGLASPPPQRRVSLPISDTASVLSSSTSSEEPRRTFPRLFRSPTTLRSQTITATNHSATETAPAAPTRVSTLPTTFATRRSTSTGSVYLQRASSKRQRKRTSLPPDLAEADEGTDSDKEQHTSAMSTTTTPKIAIAPPLPAASEEDEEAEVEKYHQTPSNRPPDPQTTVPRAHSAYLPPESTKNLWDSGDLSASLSACTTPRNSKSRPTSMIPLSSSSPAAEKCQKKHGSIRRLFSAFRRDHK
ncbi:hypothetical protein EJ05DRAFT_504479 [Pseudovirgaria hyperparasitica]|uniref:Uncharacterized protein n=1 Tax=Pseudovirgaria hyperparasitica TaxID=470096 RepID=A0A6A6VT74_9PEZI|nr:uncharacterized protein EJ05DRAFT_504479 [Pseudovirgaria hyperparasitica]KAF2753878.1 hypothetical protein EJ05DRAFT_504479 [Pseudovirgaria hyperparasitica]